MHRAGSGVIGGTDGRELYERSIAVRSSVSSPDAVRTFYYLVVWEGNPCTCIGLHDELQSSDIHQTGVSETASQTLFALQIDAALALPHDGEGQTMKGDRAYKQQVSTHYTF